MKVLMIGGGELQDSFLKQVYESASWDAVIAIDAALAAFDRLNLNFTHMVGDFDSVSPEIYQKYKARAEIKMEEHPPRKDQTDGELALQVAIAEGADEICFIGATGYRLDHMLANLELLYQAHQEGIHAYLLDPWNKVTLFSGTKRFSKEEQYGTYISFLPFTDQVSGIDLTGFSYPLQNATFMKGGSLGISNELTAATGTASAEHGILLCVESRDSRI